MPPAPKTTDKIESGRYAKKRSGIGRLLWSCFALIWALVFFVLAVLRADVAHPTSLIWAVLLLAAAIGSAYGGIYGISTWLEQRKER